MNNRCFMSQSTVNDRELSYKALMPGTTDDSHRINWC